MDNAVNPSRRLLLIGAWSAAGVAAMTAGGVAGYEFAEVISKHPVMPGAGSAIKPCNTTLQKGAGIGLGVTLGALFTVICADLKHGFLGSKHEIRPTTQEVEMIMQSVPGRMDQDRKHFAPENRF